LNTLLVIYSGFNKCFTMLTLTTLPTTKSHLAIKH
jgi:hypothetical protein